jgi:hypothetical protein
MLTLHVSEWQEVDQFHGPKEVLTARHLALGMCKGTVYAKRDDNLQDFFLNFLNWYIGVWSPIGSTRHCGHQVIMMMEKLVE